MKNKNIDTLYITALGGLNTKARTLDEINNFVNELSEMDIFKKVSSDEIYEVKTMLKRQLELKVI